MNNPFESREPSLSGPSTDLVPVIPNDGSDLENVALALYVETGGSLVIVTVKGQTRSVEVADFSVLPTGTKRVLSTGTTATGIHAFTV